VAAAVAHALELVDALVELVVAHGVHVEAEDVHRLDRRLVLEERRHERARADEVAAGDRERRPRVRRAQAVEVGVEVRPRRPRASRAVGQRDRAARFEVAVEVVEREELDVELLAAALGGGGARKGEADCGGADCRRPEGIGS
jgi:hypothetical protein